MKKKQTKIQVVKDNKKGFPKDLTAAAIEKEVTKDMKTHDLRIPAISSTIIRKYKGEELKVKVLENGFEYKGQTFKSISALAVHIVGGSISGYVFFKLGVKND